MDSNDERHAVAIKAWRPEEAADLGEAGEDARCHIWRPKEAADLGEV